MMLRGNQGQNGTCIWPLIFRVVKVDVGLWDFAPHA
jgi:hypothetical protein